MTNHFQFIGKLLSKGVLCDESNDSEAVVGLKEIMLQLAMKIAISKGPHAISGLLEALDESGNSAFMSNFQALMKEDSGETDSDLSKAKGNDLNMQAPTLEKLVENLKMTDELSSSGFKLIDKIMSRLEDGFMEQVEGFLVSKACKIINSRDFCASLTHENVLGETDVQLTTASTTHDGQWVEKAIKAACSNRAIGSVVGALQRSCNESILQDTIEWLETGPTRLKNYPISVKSLANQQPKQEPKALQSTFFDKPAPSRRFEIVATFKCPPDSSSSKGTFAVEFDRDRLIAYSTSATMNMWNLRDDNEVKQTEFGAKVKEITWFQCDEEIVVLGTAKGTLHLLDVQTLEEKCLHQLNQPVQSLKFVESTLVVQTAKTGGQPGMFWWMKISRKDMQLQRQRLESSLLLWSNINAIFFMDSDHTLLHTEGFIWVYDTKSRQNVFSGNLPCYLNAPHSINTFNVVDLISTKSNFAAGCKTGEIALWEGDVLQFRIAQVTRFQPHKAAVVSLCGVGGHLLSLDESGELRITSGHDIEKTHMVRSLELTKDFCNGNITSLFGYERWFACSSSQDGIVNVWTLPACELWKN